MLHRALIARLVALLLTTLAVLSVSGKAQAQLVINEVDYDQPSADVSEFIEITNVGGTAIDLSGYSLSLRNGASGGNTAYLEIPLQSSFILAPGAHYVVCGDAAPVANCNQLVASGTQGFLQNGAPDALALVLSGVIQDTFSYEGSVPGYTEGTGHAGDNGTGSLGLSRCPNGTDTNSNSADFLLRVLTPGVVNDCPGGGGSLGACGEAATLISAVQGPGATTPSPGATVTIEAVLVGDFQDDPLNGFYLQEEDGQHDGNPNTSEGIFVAEGGLSVGAAVGDLVRVRGTVSEVSSVTQLAASAMAVCPGSPLASTVPLSLPVASISATESLEGMRVFIAQTLTVTGNFELGRFGSLDLSVNGRLFEPTHLALPGAAALAEADLNSRSRIILDDKSNSQNPNPIPYKDADNTRRVGDTLASLEGIFEDRFGALRVQPTGTPVFSSENPRPLTPPAVGGRLKVAALNVLNYFTTLDTGTPACGPSGTLDCRGADSEAEFARQRNKTLNALETLGADVIGLIEIENNSTVAVQDLVNGLNTRLGSGTYQFINTGTIGTDAIKLAFIYKPAKVTPVGGHAVLTSAFDPAFIDTKNRPSLAQTFSEVITGSRFTAVVNHFKSKGSACDDVGDPDVGDGQGNCNLTRTAAASVLIDWIGTHPTGVVDTDYLLLGDFNAYSKEDPIAELQAAGLTELVATWLGVEAYSYQFQGESGYLDSALATASLNAQITGVAEWHSNADEPVALDYNLEFKTDDPFDDTDSFRSSDHDAIVVGLALHTASAVPAASAGSLGLLAALLLAAAARRGRR